MLPNDITLFVIDRHMNDMSLETENEFIFFVLLLEILIQAREHKWYM